MHGSNGSFQTFITSQRILRTRRGQRWDMSNFHVRRAQIKDASRLASLVHEWLNWDPSSGRAPSIDRAIRTHEFFVAEVESTIVGLIHFVLHEDVIDGAPNAFITAFYVQERHRGKGIGEALLREAVMASARRGATFIETTTLHSRAKAFYERHGFRQTFGDMGETFLELDVAGYLEAQ